MTRNVRTLGKYLASALLLLAIPLVAAGGQNDHLARIEYGMAQRMKAYAVPGVALGIIHDGKLEWSRAYGVSRLRGGVPIDENTLFQAPAISKLVAVMVAEKLTDSGILPVDADVNSTLRSWKLPDYEKATIRELISRATGFGLTGNHAQPHMMIDVLSNTGYDILEQLVADTSGKSFPQLADELVLRPLGMHRSTLERVIAFANPDFATGHHVNGEPVDVPPPVGMTSLWTTVGDLSRLVIRIQDSQSRIFVDHQDAVRASKAFVYSESTLGYECIVFGSLDGTRGAVVLTNGGKGVQFAEGLLETISREYGWPEFRN